MVKKITSFYNDNDAVFLFSFFGVCGMEESYRNKFERTEIHRGLW